MPLHPRRSPSTAARVQALGSHGPVPIASAVLLAALAAGCTSESSELVPLLSGRGAPLAVPVTGALEVVTRATAVADPLPMRSTHVAYGEVEEALGLAVSSATVPWAERHRNRAAGGGFQLYVEMTSADAQYDDGRALFTVGVRATLRARAGNVYLAQTQAACRQGGIVPPDRGGLVMARCMTEVGHQLANWLDGVDLDAATGPRPG
jgi:hypothetical protein